MQLPFELRLMIYEKYKDIANQSLTPIVFSYRHGYNITGIDSNITSFPYELPDILRMSSEISREVLLDPKWRLSMELSVTNLEPYSDTRRYATFPMVALLYGEEGQLPCLEIKSLSYDTLLLDASYKPSRGLTVRAFPLVPADRADRDVVWRGHVNGVETQRSMNRAFQERLAMDVQLSITKRRGYGIALRETEIVTFALWKFMHGLEDFSNREASKIRTSLRQKNRESHDDWVERTNGLLDRMKAEIMAKRMPDEDGEEPVIVTRKRRRRR
ncbi:hypothetical protein ANO11243_089300 [Dothideomycetidae sp. 11243]|nr:hypothetical protein ANO11243_089300 [fungal sp. No.11243]